MIALPWFLLALGIFLVLLSFFLYKLSPPSRRKPRRIKAKLRDEEIAKRLLEEQEEPVTFAALVLYAGFACIAVSVVWRFVLRFFF
jgi:uncharacterized membrane protein